MGGKLTNVGTALACLSLLAAAPSMPPQVDPLFAKLAGGPGCAVAIVQDGGIAFERGYGLADLETKRPITAETNFNIASMTKQFTAMAIALLIADGKLSEQDDVRKYLPELKDYGTPIRIANLLNHSSGLRNHMALAAFQPGDHLPSHEEALALVFRQSALNFAPGTRHQYESPNYVLLAEVVSRASEMPYERFLEERIFKPLGMADTGFNPDGLARAYSKGEKGWTLQEKVNRAKGSSGLLSTVHDFAIWMANYDRLTVGGKAALDRMLSTSRLADGTAISYRYGLAKEFDYAGVKGLTRITHGGQTAAYRSAFSYFPGRGLGDVIMCNQPVDAQALDLHLVARFMAHLKGPNPTSGGGSGVAQGMHVELPEQLAGTYYSSQDDDIREFVAKDGGLAVKAFGQSFPLGYVEGRTFALEDQGEFRFTDGSVTEAVKEQAKLQFERLPTPQAQDFGAYSGTYRSGDVDGEVTIEAKGDRLVLRYPAGEAELRAVGRDHFSGQEYDFSSVRFHRSAGGEIDGLVLTVASGITRLRFERSR